MASTLVSVLLRIVREMVALQVEEVAAEEGEVEGTSVDVEVCWVSNP